MKCRLCLTTCDPEHPETVHGLNPSTFRNATMHRFCFVVAFEDLEGVKASQIGRYADRQDEYIDRMQEGFLAGGEG